MAGIFDGILVYFVHAVDFVLHCWAGFCDIFKELFHAHSHSGGSDLEASPTATFTMGACPKDPNTNSGHHASLVQGADVGGAHLDPCTYTSARRKRPGPQVCESAPSTMTDTSTVAKSTSASSSGCTGQGLDTSTTATTPLPGASAVLAVEIASETVQRPPQKRALLIGIIYKLAEQAAAAAAAQGQPSSDAAVHEAAVAVAKHARPTAAAKSVIYRRHRKEGGLLTGPHSDCKEFKKLLIGEDPPYLDGIPET
jgi:hypothetical protein